MLKSQLQIALLIYLSSSFLLLYLRPKFIFRDNNTSKKFGTNHSKKTIFPLWLIISLIGIFSYAISLTLDNYLQSIKTN